MSPSPLPEMSASSTASRVACQSALARKYDRKLDQLREEWRGREADYLTQVHRSFGERLEWLRGEIYRFTGVDILTKKAAPEGERLPTNPLTRDYLSNLYADRNDIVRISILLDQVGKAADRYGRSREVEQFEMFCWAMKYCTVAETVFLIENLEGDKEKQLTIEHLAGWVDVRANLHGPQASRLVRGLGVDSTHARDALREQLPSAVVVAMQEWRPGKELPENDRPIVFPGKQTAGRQPRSLKSRILRELEAKTSMSEYAIVDVTESSFDPMTSSGHEEQLISTLAQDSIAMARAAQMDLQGDVKSHFSDLLRDFADSGIPGPNERRLALYLSENTDLLDAKNGKVCMQYGGHQVMAHHFSRSAGQLRVEFQRMMQKLKAYALAHVEEF